MVLAMTSMVTTRIHDCVGVQAYHSFQGGLACALNFIPIRQLTTFSLPIDLRFFRSSEKLMIHAQTSNSMVTPKFFSTF